MISVKVIFLVATCLLLIHEHDCKEDNIDPAKVIEMKSRSIKTMALKKFRDMILGKKIKNNEYLDIELKTLSTVRNINKLTQDIVESAENTHELTTLTTALADLSVLFDKMDHAYDIYLMQKDSKKDATDPSLHKFVDETRNPYQGPIDYLNTIYSRVVPKNLDANSNGVGYLNDVSVLSLLTKHMMGFKRMCNKQKSQQQILHMLFISIGVAEMKLYSMLEFCYKKLADIQESNYEQEMNLLTDQLYKRGSKAAVMFERFMNIASREVWRCDPKRHIEDVTYTELKEVFQKYVVNDEDMNNEKSCLKRCGDFTNAVPSECVNKEDHYDIETGYTEYSICDQHRKCNGALHDCEDYFSEYNELWICPSTLNSSRRYEFMEHGSVDHVFKIYKIKKYGHSAEKSDCERDISYDYREFGSQFKDIWRHCEICLCTCHDHKSPTSEQRVNVRPNIADNDFVITGARLVKNNHILHIQIEQGKVLSDGRVDEKSLHWKPIAAPRDASDLQSYSWTDFRSIYLGVSEISRNRVAVGVKFSVVKNGESRMLAMKTLSVPYNYTTGNLTYDRTYYVEPETYDPQEIEFDPLPDFVAEPLTTEFEVDLKNCDVPLNAEFPSLPQPSSKKFVKFTTSDFKKDLGQSMIPFVDIQDVVTRPAVPISGIGFYHKTHEGYGGFLGLKLLTYNHAPFIN